MPTKAFVYVLTEKLREGSVQSELEKKLFPDKGILAKLAPRPFDEAYGPLRAFDKALEPFRAFDKALEPFRPKGVLGGQ